ncbi:MAG: hypothetical protein FJX75_19210 [Armatimonadetes bacterium]|nr:hypothetical protein [Armatimonadota bacterium]
MLRVWLVVFAVGLLPRADASTWDTWGEYATRLEPLEPTPMGDGHVGVVKSGDTVQLRVPVPQGHLLGYWLSLGNVVAYTGKGTSYQLVLRRDAPDGPVIYEGPTLASGEQFNADNREVKDITAHVTAEDQRKGSLDVWATAKVVGDDWTIYRHNPQGREVVAFAAVASAELEAKLAAAKSLAQLGVAIIPMPQEVKVGEGQLRLSPTPRIVLGSGADEQDAFAAQDLAEQIAAKTAAKPVVVREKPPAGHIVIRAAKAGELGPPGVPGQYALKVAADAGVEIIAADAAGRFYGAQTLAQLIADEKTDPRPQVPALTIRDWPAFPVRSFQYDIARGNTVDVEFCKHVIRDLARYKLNDILFYLEDDFRFTKYPFTGRPGTFTPEKAKVLSDYARQYHMTLTPQFEALGHASALLSHPELADLREAGNSWVFCTSNPRTWEFLGDVFAELAACFPNSPYLHVGADEFEGAFGLCDQCKTKSVGALYVEHMTRLNDICRSLDRTMLFWPSHGGPTPDLSYMTLSNAAAMPHDCIPTEWIYHGPPSYPEIAQYQEAGFRDVWVCPAVNDWFMVWPDYPTSFRGIRGFYRAGAARKVGGACTTTWGLMRGSLFETSWLGLCYAAECGWSLGSTSVSDFERRFAASWLGVRGEGSEQLVADTLAEPVPSTGPAARWRDYSALSNLLLTPLKDTQRQYALKDPTMVASAPALVDAADAALGRLKALESAALRGKDTLAASRTCLGMIRLAGLKLQALDGASRRYSEASRAQSPADAGKALREAAEGLAPLGAEYDGLAQGLDYAVAHWGASDEDLKAIQNQAAEVKDLTAKLGALADDVAAGRAAQLPPAEQLGLQRGVYTRIAQWAPAHCSEEGFEIRADLTGKVKPGESATVEFEYTSGAHALRISRVALLVNGQEVAVDEHDGITGASNQGNRYHVTAPKEVAPDAEIEVVASARSWGGNDSAGTIWLARDE